MNYIETKLKYIDPIKTKLKYNDSIDTKQSIITQLKMERKYGDREWNQPNDISIQT